METKRKMTIAGIIMGLIGILIGIEFLAVDAALFNVQPPQWIITLSNMIPLNGLDLDLLLTFDMLLLIAEFHWQGEPE
jgi:hypothetical protein